MLVHVDSSTVTRYICTGFPGEDGVFPKLFCHWGKSYGRVEPLRRQNHLGDVVESLLDTGVKVNARFEDNIHDGFPAM